MTAHTGCAGVPAGFPPWERGRLARSGNRATAAGQEAAP